jgi:cell division control protein 6
LDQEGERVPSGPSGLGSPSGGPGRSGAVRESPPEAASPVKEVFDDILRQSSALYKGSPDVLREAYVPPRLPHREEEIRKVAQVLAPALRGETPSNLLIYGKIGTGKTAVVTQVRKDMARRTGLERPIRFVLANCANVDTHYALLQTLANSLVEKDEERIPTGWSLDRVYSAFCNICDRVGGTILLVLDEIDKLVKNSGDGVLYSLAQINTELKGARVGIIGISNDLHFTELLDARVRSRLNEEKILFPPYDADQLRDILEDRAREVFQPGVLQPGVLERCAAYAAQENGDARRALALLRVAAQIAERKGNKQIRDDDVIEAKSRLERDIITDCVKTLSPHYKILLWAIVASSERRGARGLETGAVYEAYRHVCQKAGASPLHFRSISNHLADLEDLGLIRARVISKGRGGRTREIEIAVPPQETLRALEEDSLLQPLSRSRGTGQTSLFRFGGGFPT